MVGPLNAVEHGGFVATGRDDYVFTRTHELCSTAWRRSWSTVSVVELVQPVSLVELV